MVTPVAYKIFLHWLWLAGLILFGLYLAYDLGVLSAIIQADITRICLIILLIFAGTSVHCAYRCWFLARQFLVLDRFRLQYHQPLECSPEDPAPEEPSLALDYLRALLEDDSDHDTAQLAEVMAESIRGSH